MEEQDIAACINEDGLSGQFDLLPRELQLRILAESYASIKDEAIRREIEETGLYPHLLPIDEDKELEIIHWMLVNSYDNLIIINKGQFANLDVSVYYKGKTFGYTMVNRNFLIYSTIPTKLVGIEYESKMLAMQSRKDPHNIKIKDVIIPPGMIEAYMLSHGSTYNDIVHFRRHYYERKFNENKKESCNKDYLWKALIAALLSGRRDDLIDIEARGNLQKEYDNEV